MPDRNLDDGPMDIILPVPLEGVIDSIRRMTATVRRFTGDRMDAETGYGWWVLAVGEPFADGALEDRDRARNQLQKQVEAAGVVLAEYVWVWDDQNRAQLVLASLPSKGRAQRVARRLREKGLTVRVTRETL